MPKNLEQLDQDPTVQPSKGHQEQPTQIPT